ncbi:MAG: hypothetical protein A2W05_07395 [Candidatus Schekmanbacteria bacterium RBG_16_38_10]|uniref:Sporulation stage II protein D amidase enhancer LytB N-terminal domain-containing protein n=1 Tax=Candidatus Schekmanbacteria bacterium RBG_16_38_10 TaxID=1817879 RepID=A0A1F7RR54_9BACT|nr:MAG: hypothetical protein A2W05_07395 [Candidatus Schekmanbacteria bacterium RBG_16_38_10]
MITKEVIDTSNKKSDLALAYKINGDIYKDVFECYEKAIDEYNKALSLSIDKKSSEEIHFSISKIYFDMRDYLKAKNEFENFLANYPETQRRESAEIIIQKCKTYIKEPLLMKEPAKEKKDYSNEEIRVAYKWSKRFRITSKAGIKIFYSSGINNYRPIKKAEISVSENGIVVDSKDSPFQQITIEPENGSFITVDGKNLRGKITVLKDNDGLLIINKLNIEEYLYGVLPQEVNPNWNIEALKSQAVASRTYALFRAKLSRDKPFDLDATKFSQVYGGFDREKKNSNYAVDITKGKVITYKGKLILSYFHSNSGGFLEASENVWGIDLPYLDEKKDEFSINSSDYKWSYSVKLRELEKMLNENGIKVSKISEIVPVKKSSYGRIIKVSISHQGGKLELNGNTFRLKIGPYNMKSTLCEISKNGDVIKFSGRGFGHGVGMSQWGAYNMAKKGYSCKDILAFYYKGTEVE